MSTRGLVSGGITLLAVGALLISKLLPDDSSQALQERLLSEKKTSVPVSLEQKVERAQFNARIRQLPAAGANSAISSEEMVNELEQAAASIKTNRKKENKSDTESVKNELKSLRSMSEDGESLSIQRDHSGNIMAISTRIPIPNDLTAEKAIDRLISEHPSLFGINMHETISVERRSQSAENDVQSFVVKKQFKGLPVWGDSVKITGDRNAISGIAGRLSQIPEGFDISGRMTPDQFEAAVRADSKKPVFAVERDTLEEGIYFLNNLPGHAYRGRVSFGFLQEELVYVSPKTGRIISAESLVYQASARSQGTDLKGETVSFFSDDDGIYFNMIDRRTLEGIADGNSVSQYVRQDFYPPERSLASQSGWDSAAVSALANAEKSLRYFKETHNRSSFNNQGLEARSVVNMYGDFVFSNGDRMPVGPNALWMANTMWYGNGGGLVRNFAGALDIAGHELTHGVIENSSKLAYKNQSGALNESFADIFGTMIERKNWTIGEDLDPPAEYVDLFLRSMIAPEIYGNPGHMRDFRRMPVEQDNGGVHINSSIPNRAFYLLAEGLTAEVKGQSVGIEKAEKLAYETMVALSENDTFIYAAIKMIQVAEARYGRASSEVASVKAAWTEVGVYREGTNSDTDDQVVEPAPVNLATGDDVLFFLRPRDGNLEASSLYTEEYDVYGITVEADGQAIEGTLVGPLNDNPASGTVPFLYTESTQLTVLFYRGTDGVIYFNDLSGASADQPFAVDFVVSQLAVSPDGSKLAVVPADSNLILVYDFELDEAKRFVVSGPDYSSSTSLSTVDLVDAIDFDNASNRIVFDYRSCDRFGLEEGSDCVEVWNIGILDLTVGFEYPFPNLPGDISLGFPKFSNIGRNAIVFDLFDYADWEVSGEVDSVVFTWDFINKTSNVVTRTTDDLSSSFPGAPSFVGDDQAISYNGNFDPDFTTIVRAKLNTSFNYDSSSDDGLMFFIPYEGAWANPHRLAFQSITAELSVWPRSSFYFGRFEKGPEKQAEITLKNTGNRKIEITGTEISPSLTTNITNLTLLAGEEQSFKVYFDSSNAPVGNYSGQIRVNHDADNPSIVIGFSADLLDKADSGGDLSDTPDDSSDPVDDPGGPADDSSDPVDDSSDSTSDRDGDGVLDAQDNCPLIWNRDQVDTDGDGIGDSCDRIDNSDPAVGEIANSYTTTVGTDLSATTASMEFGFVGAEINSAMDSSFLSIDSLANTTIALVEGGFKGDTFGVFRVTVTSGQVDASSLLTLAIPDLLSTTTEEITINYSLTGANVTRVNKSQVIRGPGSVDNDPDGDGIRESEDNCPFVANQPQNDLDSDGAGDACDSDDDNDGVADIEDTCPLLSDEEQTDSDFDGLGNPCDPDDDNDGVIDDEDLFPLDPTRSTEPLKGIQYLQTTSDSANVTTLHVINTSEERQVFSGLLRNGAGQEVGKGEQELGSAVASNGRLVLTSADLESIFDIDPWKGPAMLRIEGKGPFELMSRLESPSGLVSNTNCVREDRVLNIEGFDSSNMSYIRFINTKNESTGEIKGTLYGFDGRPVGTRNILLVSDLAPYEQVWISRDSLSQKIGAEWNGEGMLEVTSVDGLKLLNLNFITDESTFFNFSCFENGNEGTARIYLQTTSTSANVSSTHIVNTSDLATRFIGTLYGSDGSQVGDAGVPLHSGIVPKKGRIVISSEDIEEAFEIPPWTGPAVLEINSGEPFELMTKLKSPSGLISNTNCVRENQIHNIGGFDQTDVTYVRFINTGDTAITNIKGSLYDSSGNVIGSTNPILIDELPAKAHVWKNRNQLSDLAGDTWNGTASLKIDNADDNLRLLNLNFINNETFFNFSCYESGQ